VQVSSNDNIFGFVSVGHKYPVLDPFAFIDLASVPQLALSVFVRPMAV